jgi:hypothetical protein
VAESPKGISEILELVWAQAEARVIPEGLLLEPGLLDALVIAAEDSDPERRAAAVFSISAHWLWSKAPNVDKFMEQLPRLRDSVLRVTGCQPPYSEPRWKAWALRNKAFKSAKAQKAAMPRRGRHGRRDERPTSERTKAIFDADLKRGSPRPVTTKYCADIARDVSIGLPKSVPGRRKALKRIYAVLHRNSNR